MNLVLSQAIGEHLRRISIFFFRLREVTNRCGNDEFKWRIYKKKWLRGRVDTLIMYVSLSIH